MTLETEFCMYRSWGDETRDRQAEKLLNTIAAFAKMDDNAAFWTDGVDELGTNCIAVNGYLDGLDTGECIPCKDIEKVVRAWCVDLADWCRSDPDTDIDDKANKRLSIKIEDRVSCGGFSVIAFDKDGQQDHVLHILPVEKTETEEAKNGND